MAEVVLLHGAEQDLLEIYSAIFDRDPDRAERFSVAADRVMANLSQFPESGRPFGVRFRRKLVPRFYEFGVFYVVESDRVMIHAILNLRQDPERIRQRLGIK